MRKDPNEKKILVGKTAENNAIILEFCLRDNYNRPENQHFSISGIELDLSQTYTDESGEEAAKEYLKNDDSLWKDAVASGRTQKGFEEWNEEVLNTDGWENVIGDIEEVGNGVYVRWGSCGQIDMHTEPEDFAEVVIAKEDLATIWAAWKTLHLKAVDSLNQGEKQLWEKVKAIVEKYPEFENRQIEQFL